MDEVKLFECIPEYDSQSFANAFSTSINHGDFVESLSLVKSGVPSDPHGILVSIKTGVFLPNAWKYTTTAPHLRLIEFFTFQRI